MNRESDSAQLKKYAEDLQKIYKSEKGKKAELETAYKQLKKYADDLRKTVSNLEDANKKLMKQVELEEREKTVERKLIHANRMESLGTMASGIAHEINNPISFLLGNSQILMEIWADAEGLIRGLRDTGTDVILGGLSLDDILEHIPKILKGNVEGTERINNIVSGLKDYSAFHLEGEVKNIRVNAVIQFAITLFEQKLKSAGINLITELQDPLPEPVGNPEQIEQVIINLLQNSLNAMNDRRGAIYIRSAYKKKSGYVTITLKDEGKGIEKEHLPRVTEPFFTTTRAQGGTGLGLYISYSIIREHKGTLEINSEPGQGTAVIVSLPVLKEK